MTDILTQALNVTLELEGLLILKRERGELAPAEIDNLILSKNSELSTLIGSWLGSGVTHAPEIQNSATEIPEPLPEETKEKIPAQPEPVRVKEAENDPEYKSSQEIHAENASDAVMPTAVSDAKPLDVKQEQSASSAVDIRKGLSLNDKFLFRRELFEGQDNNFEEALHVIGSMTNVDEIKDYLYNDMCLDPESDTVKHFIETVTRIIKTAERNRQQK